MNKQIKTIAVCGAGGTMGMGIALVAARAGHRTLCYDLSDAGLANARKQSEAFLQNSVARGKISQQDMDDTLSRMQPTSKLGDLAEADLVIEAIFESLEVKQSLIRSLDTVCDEATIFASNTSTLSITQIASGSAHPERVIGLHFCLPAQLMKLIEVSPGLLTSAETLATAWSWCESSGQIPVKTQDRPGFILNALLVPFNNDAIRAVEAGLASPEDIDLAIKTALGYKMGPLELLDLVGLDTQVLLCEAFYDSTLDPRAAAPPLLNRMVAAGLLGRKSGRGFFTYNTNAMFGA
jgi:3-hydroxybutyryl-CoA dehydrogenase